MAAVAHQAQRSDVLQIAFATALDYRYNMIRVPEGFPAHPFQPPADEQLLPVNSPRSLQIQIRGAAIDPANRADTLVARENLITQISRIRSQTPFVHAPIRAERESPRRDFKITPAAQRPAIPALIERGSIGKPAGHRPGSAHKTFLS